MSHKDGNSEIVPDVLNRASGEYLEAQELKIVELRRNALFGDYNLRTSSGNQ